MQIWQSIVLGIVQGLTEFLPVSSSGHLELTKAMLSIRLGSEELLFDLILHAGTLLAVLIVYRKQLYNLLQKPYKTLLWLLTATIPAGFAGLFFDDFLEKNCLNGLSVGICFLITAALLLLCERAAKRKKKKPFGFFHATAMGVGQAFAVLPGISRSGSTIAIGVLAGAESEQVADFSFLMSVPVIGGSLVVKIGKLLLRRESLLAAAEAFQTPQNMALCLFFGVASAAIVGILSIYLVLSAVKKANYKWFSLYLALVAALSFTLYGKGIFV